MAFPRRRRSITQAPGHLESCELFGDLLGCQCVDTAYHEAGHAVVAWAAGVRIRWIDVRSRRGDTIGQIEIDRKRRPAIVEARIDLAGDIAELLRRGFSQERVDQILVAEDEIAVTEEGKRVWRRFGAARAGEIALEAAGILRTHWPLVEHLAETLLAGRFLMFGREARALLQETPCPTTSTA